MFYLKKLFSAAGTPLLAVSVLTLSAISGCQQSSNKSTPADTSKAKPTPTRPAAVTTPEANIFVDEAMLAKPYAVIGGAVENIGGQKLEKLSVEIELRRRADGSVERREVSVKPEDLEPGKQGKFSLKVLSEEWAGSRVVRLRSAARQGEEIAFRSQPGAKRPPEKVKENKENVVVVKTPTRKKSDGSDFINTPDTPYNVP
ncbi:MAG TPA: hypothetical protein VF611_01575 [Pyrinomonadaceae bacterium]|jgi:hypothetical protein